MIHGVGRRRGQSSGLGDDIGGREESQRRDGEEGYGGAHVGLLMYEEGENDLSWYL